MRGDFLGTGIKLLPIVREWNSISRFAFPNLACADSVITDIVLCGIFQTARTASTASVRPRLGFRVNSSLDSTAAPLRNIRRNE
mgnify:CR=1 FL=1